MKANELRIGNYVSYFGNSTVKIETIRKDVADYYLIGGIYRNGYTTFYNQIDVISPIPLTKEWLSEFGFVGIDNPNGTPSILYKIKGHPLIEIIFTVFPVTRYNLRCESEKEIQYVHQLQNLYFALTGEELNINL
jgi:hypothetical protein